MSETTTYKALLRAGQTVALTTRGASMRPLFRADDTTVVVEPIRQPLHRGDLPLYLRCDGKYVIHRIVGIGNGGYLTLGDNSYMLERVMPQQVVGVVTQFCRGGKCLSVADRRYKTYVWLWMRLAPLRMAAHKMWVKTKETTLYNKLKKEKL